MTPGEYSRKRTRSLRAAMAEALATKLLEARFPLGDGSSLYLAAVYDAWPSSEDHFQTPSAVVLPGAATYEDAGMTPTLIRDTWEPPGQPGLGLYKTSELVVPFEIQVRAPTDAERDVIVAGVEDLWVADGVLMDHQEGARYGVVLPLPSYWGVSSTYSLQSVRILDDPERAIRNQNEAVFAITGRAPQVKLGPVQPMKVTVKVDV